MDACFHIDSNPLAYCSLIWYFFYLMLMYNFGTWFFFLHSHKSIFFFYCYSKLLPFKYLMSLGTQSGNMRLNIESNKKIASNVFPLRFSVKLKKKMSSSVQSSSDFSPSWVHFYFRLMYPNRMWGFFFSRCLPHFYWILIFPFYSNNFKRTQILWDRINCTSTLTSELKIQ